MLKSGEGHLEMHYLLKNTLAMHRLPKTVYVCEEL